MQVYLGRLHSAEGCLHPAKITRIQSLGWNNFGRTEYCTCDELPAGASNRAIALAPWAWATSSDWLSAISGIAATRHDFRGRSKEVRSTRGAT